MINKISSIFYSAKQKVANHITIPGWLKILFDLFFAMTKFALKPINFFLLKLNLIKAVKPTSETPKPTFTQETNPSINEGAKTTLDETNVNPIVEPIKPVVYEEPKPVSNEGPKPDIEEDLTKIESTTVSEEFTVDMNPEGYTQQVMELLDTAKTVLARNRTRHQGLPVEKLVRNTMIRLEFNTNNESDLKACLTAMLRATLGANERLANDDNNDFRDDAFEGNLPKLIFWINNLNSSGALIQQKTDTNIEDLFYGKVTKNQNFLKRPQIALMYKHAEPFKSAPVRLK